MFETETIRLRKLTNNDFEIYHNWRNDTEVMYSTSPNLDIYTLEETEKYISMMANISNAKGYIIEHKKADKAVGIISLINIDYKNRSAECVIDIGAKDMWGQGIGSSAMALIMDYAFKELNMHRVYLQVFSFNINAIKLYEKMGFVHEGSLRSALYRSGKWHDIILMSILKSEYKSKLK